MAKEKVGVMALEDLKYYLHSQLQKYSSYEILANDTGEIGLLVL